MGLAGLALILLPISLQAQLVLSFGVLGFMFITMSRPENKVFRMMTYFFVGILALRYAYWRTADTLPSIYEPWNFVPGFLLYLAEMYCLAMLAVSLFMLADPLKRTSPPMPAIDDLPTVDVFIPS